MTSLDDQLYQLFSQLVVNAKAQTDTSELSFDAQALKRGEGPIEVAATSPDKSYQLGPRSSIIGLGHPLIYKSRLIGSLSPELFCSEAEQDKFFSELSSFLTLQAGFPIFAYFGQSGTNLSTESGRHSQFFDPQSIESLKNNSTITVYNIFPFAITLSNQKAEHYGYLTHDHLIQAKSIFKLLKLGDFYGKTGHIQRMSESLAKSLKGVKEVTKVEGLLIRLEQDKNYSFLEKGQSTIYLPLFFKPSFLEELKKLITE